MAKYGMPYKGSKSKIAEWIIGNLPSGDTFVDLFAGGCAVTHAAMVSGKYNRFIANDIRGTVSFFEECARGEMEGYSFVPTRDEFHSEKVNDMAVSILMSFGNNQKDYLWSEKLEPVKVEASRMLSAPSIHERRIHYRKFIRMLGEYGLKEAKGHNGDLQKLESLERLERLQNLERPETFKACAVDYTMVEIPAGSVVYADPPYRGTNCGAYDGFDHERFDSWLSSVSFPVFVSEYTCPKGCIEIASIEKRVLSDAKGTGKIAIERLFVQERFADMLNTKVAE